MTTATKARRDRDPNWVLHTPYTAPDRYWLLDERGRAATQTNPGRRPSSTLKPVPQAARTAKGKTQKRLGAYTQTVEPHTTINRIRSHVEDWRTTRYRGAHPRVAGLLDYWKAEDTPTRPFWCQVDAVETLIWLRDAGRIHRPDEHERIIAEIDGVNARWNAGIGRLGVKMATGTGKTHVMAMTALWLAVSRPGETVGILTITPGLTVKNHLSANLADRENALWRDMTPRGYEADADRIQWAVTNFQALKRRSTLSVDGEKDKAGKNEKLTLLGPKSGRGETPAGWVETDRQFGDRVLADLKGSSRVFVFNDESHHCYTMRNADIGRGRADAETKADAEIGELWFSGIETLHKSERVESVFDYSATPMWLRVPRALQAETHPWTISDFGLIEALESGLVKVPRVPIEETAVDTDGSALHLAPRYRNVYEYNERRSLAEGLPEKVAESLDELYKSYAALDARYRKKGLTTIPVMIVAANTIENATALYEYIAGRCQNGGTGIWARGQCKLLSNVDPNTSTPVAEPPTLLVHSRLDEPAEIAEGGKSTKKTAEAVEAQASIFAPNAKTKDEKRTEIRKIFMSVGKPGQAGANIRCVVSVGMLTEGWDAKTVTHIFGYRAFNSDLLAEQVVGRALRRTAFHGGNRLQPMEYAEVYGVPFSWMPGTAKSEPIDPIEPKLVHSIEERARLRLRFPHIGGYRKDEVKPQWTLDPKGVDLTDVKRRLPSVTVLEGTTGNRRVADPALKSPQGRLWNAAARLEKELGHRARADGSADANEGHRRERFIDCVTAMRECAEATDRDPLDLARDEAALDRIARAVERTETRLPVQPIFENERNRARKRYTDTSGIEFETTLPHYTGVTKSELNAAACHSKEERELATILDRHDGITSHVRNFRLGWYVPWWDEERQGWRRMEPDFIALTTEPIGGRPHHLIIEFKGRNAGTPTERAKEMYLSDLWAPAASNAPREAGEADNGVWTPVWIENIEQAQAQIDAACERRETT